MPLIGVLAVQGGAVAHQRHLQRLGAQTRLVRRTEDLDAIDGIVLPGGESTAIRQLLVTFGLWEPLREHLQSGLPAFGSCAGMILLSRGDDTHPGLAAIDITVQRNAFGSQVESFECEVEVKGLDGEPFPAVFIRAPQIQRSGPDVQRLADVDGRIVAASQGNILVVAFHPELTDDDRMHEMWLNEFALSTASQH